MRGGCDGVTVGPSSLCEGPVALRCSCTLARLARGHGVARTLCATLWALCDSALHCQQQGHGRHAEQAAAWLGNKQWHVHVPQKQASSRAQVQTRDSMQKGKGAAGGSAKLHAHLHTVHSHHRTGLESIGLRTCASELQLPWEGLTRTQLAQGSTLPSHFIAAFGRPTTLHSDPSKYCSKDRCHTQCSASLS